MPKPFRPLALKSLAEIDQAEAVEYEDSCTAIEGVVSPGSQGGWPCPGGGYDVHCFSLAGWRRTGESFIERELTILRPVPLPGREQGKTTSYLDEFPSYSVQRLNMLLSKDQTRAVLEKCLPSPDADAVLLSFSKRLQQPVILSTNRFGNFTLNKSVDIFEGMTEWNSEIINIYFSKDSAGSVVNAVKTAEMLCADQKTWKRRVEDFAVQRLLPLKNESWLDEGEAELSPEDFKARMSLQSISFGRDGKFDFWHDDGDIFWGHSIQISGNLSDGLTDADIPG